jgi:hypothetical protein
VVGKNPYMAWDKDYLIFNSDNNTVPAVSGLTVTYAYRAPKYL